MTLSSSSTPGIITVGQRKTRHASLVIKEWILRSRQASKIVGAVPVLAGIAVVASAGLAQAQGAPPGSTPPVPYAWPPPEPPGIQRSGFIIGFSLGGGSIGCSDCNESDSLRGVALEIHLGGMLTRNVALMFDGSGVAHTFNGDATLTHVVDVLAVQVWATDRLWFKGGVGIGQISISADNSSTQRSDTHAAGMFAVGVELFQGRASALDLQLRGAATSFSDGTITNGSFLIGYSWY